MEELWIILSVVLILLIAVGAFLLDKFVISKKRWKKKIEELERKYEYSHALLAGQDTNYISRIEVISRTNLTYTEIHSSFFKRIKSIKENNDAQCADIIKKLKELLEQNKLKEFKIYYKENLQICENYDDLVKKLDADLTEVLRPEEEVSQACLVLREKTRQIKSTYNNLEFELLFVKNTFNDVFAEIEKQFADFDALVVNAKYQEANELLPKIENVLTYLSKGISLLPSYIDEINKLIPERIEKFKNYYEDLTSQKYPLVTLQLIHSLNLVEEDLNKTREELLKLNLDKIPEDIKNINERIDVLNDTLNKEVDSREAFENRNQIVRKNFNELQNEFIKVSNNISKIKQYYIIDEEHTIILNEIKTELEKVFKDNQRLDMYLHSGDKTPFSTLLCKMEDLEKGCDQTSKKFNDFLLYLDNLKKSSENAFELIGKLFNELNKYESKVHEFNNEKYSNIHKEKFNRCFEIIDDLDKTLSNIPIDVNKVNELTEEINKTSNKLFITIDEDYDYFLKCQKLFLICNKGRTKYNEVNNSMNQAEKLFFETKYSDAFVILEATHKIINQRTTTGS